jgi:hypothetical protein
MSSLKPSAITRRQPDGAEDDAVAQRLPATGAGDEGADVGAGVLVAAEVLVGVGAGVAAVGAGVAGLGVDTVDGADVGVETGVGVAAVVAAALADGDGLPCLRAWPGGSDGRPPLRASASAIRGKTIVEAE